LLLLLLGLPQPATASGPGFPRDLVQAVLGTAFDVVLDRALEAVPPGVLGLRTVRGAVALDPALGAEWRGGMLGLFQDGRPLLVRPVPNRLAAMRSAAPLAGTVTALLDAAWQASPALREAGAERMLQAAMEAMLEGLDPYSRYLSPAEAAAARIRRVGQSALGLQLAPGPGQAVIVAALAPAGTAARVGLRIGDRLLAIDGEPVSARRLAEAVELLEGPAGSAALLRVQRGGRRFDLVLPREVVAPDSVRWQARDGILWLRIEAFANDTDQRLLAALDQGIEPGKTRGIVLDLRGNRGGLLTQAVATAAAFLTGGVVARTAGRHPDTDRTYLADDEDHAAGLPLVVLVDGRTASAAEIVAAALADRGRAVVIGSATTGKGLIQIVAPLAHGGELDLSWARVLAPSGWPIQDLGVLPAICTSRDEAEAAVALLRQGQSPAVPALRRMRPLRAPLPPAEVAALRAACPPAEGREGDLAVAAALLENPAAYAEALGR
jgi:carboxyl-terminal processing protease